MFQQQTPAPKCFGGCSVKVLAIAQVVCGGLAIILGVAIIVLRNVSASTGYPIWTGALFLSTGIVGIFAAKRKTKGLIIAFMVLSILSAVFTTNTLGFSAGAVELDRWSYSYDCYYYTRPYYYDCPTRTLKPAKLAMDALLIIIALVEAGLAIASAVMACCAVCPCCGASGADNCCNCNSTSGFQPPAVAYQVGADGRLVQIPIMQGGQPIAMTSFPTSQSQQAIVLPSAATAQQLQLVTHAPANMPAAQGYVGSGQGPKPQGSVVFVPAGPQAQGGAPATSAHPQMIQPLSTVGHSGNIQYVIATSTPIPVPQAAGQQQPQPVPQVQFQQPNLAVLSPYQLQPPEQQQPNIPQHDTPMPPSPPPSYQPTDPVAGHVNESLKTDEDDVPLVD